MRPKVIAVTGSIGAGKSLVGTILAQRGYEVIDTDNVVHELFESSAELRDSIGSRFGKEVISPAGKIDRKKLGAIVFDNHDARKDLERIVHPEVLKACDRILAGLAEDKHVFMLVPLLFEAGIEDRYEKIWSVVADESALRARLKQNRGLSDEEITQRLSAQIPQPEKARRSDCVINNSGTISDTEAQIDAILENLSL